MNTNKFHPERFIFKIAATDVFDIKLIFVTDMDAFDSSKKGSLKERQLHFFPIENMDGLSKVCNLLDITLTIHDTSKEDNK